MTKNITSLRILWSALLYNAFCLQKHSLGYLNDYEVKSSTYLGFYLMQIHIQKQTGP